jgi:hypothetical protein
VTDNITLRGDQIDELVQLLTRLFDLDELEQLVRMKLNLNLFGKVASPDKPLRAVSAYVWEPAGLIRAVWPAAKPCRSLTRA